MSDLHFHHLAAEGNDIVLWSEEGVVVQGEANESSLLSTYGNLSAAQGVFLGVTYDYTHDDGTLNNMLTLLLPDGTVGFKCVDSTLSSGRDTSLPRPS